MLNARAYSFFTNIYEKYEVFVKGYKLNGGEKRVDKDDGEKRER